MHCPPSSIEQNLLHISNSFKFSDRRQINEWSACDKKARKRDYVRNTTNNFTVKVIKKSSETHSSFELAGRSSHQVGEREKEKSGG